MQNHKSGTLGSLVPTMTGMPYDNFTQNHYVHNTNTQKTGYVFYMRQNEV